jgi:hypothetical protein
MAMNAGVLLLLGLQLSLGARFALAQPSQPAPECPNAEFQPYSPFPDSSRPHKTTPTALCVLVSSNGCTERESFDVAVVPGDPLTRVTLTRLRPDPCRMRSHKVWLRFGWAELGLDGPRPVVVDERAAR